MKKIFLGIGVSLALLFLGLVGSGFYFNRIMYLPTGAMSNTIIVGEHILVSGFFSEIRRGDIMIFKFPNDPKIKYCMRVIGLPNETIQIRGQKVYINDQELFEKRIICELSYEGNNRQLKEISVEGSGSYNTYHDKDKSTDDPIPSYIKYGVDQSFKIPAGEYFVMGDSRDNSLDSRSWGTVKTEAMLYKAKKIVSSPSDSRLFTDLK
jgi:signal peptidase I